jgi:3-hydroxyacyl-CoA dehydrogenase
VTAIERAAVIGAGVMGTGIAAHIASAGVPVVLLDVVPGAAAAAIERALKTEPAAFMTRGAARLVTTGDLPGEIGLLAGCDWIVEAVREDADVKRALYAQIAPKRRPGSILSSNTSTIPLAELAPADPDFLITHFFNPPRYLRLLELVAGPATRAEAVDAIEAFADHRLGKAVVRCNDTPGFIANRLGGAWIDTALAEAVQRGLTIETADAAISRAFGVPRTGVFGLLDLVGIDLSLLVTRSFAQRLAADDPMRTIDRPLALLESMVADGRTGRKGDGGFYRLERAGETRTKRALDLATRTYRPAERSRGDDPAAAAYAEAVVAATLAYAEYILDEVSGDRDVVDRAMETGYGWRQGPFAMLRARTGEAGARHIRRPAGVLLLRDVKQDAEPVRQNRSAALWDVGDGVLCLEFTSKMNSIDPQIIAMAMETLVLCGGDGYRALVLHNEGENFSVGANLGGVLLTANIGAWDQLALGVAGGQGAFAALKYASFPVVAAPHGLALGGGCEVSLHADAIQAHAELYMGLVEAGVGIVPGWGGCKETLIRMTERHGRRGPMPPVQAAFELIGLAKVSKSAAEARELGFLRDTDAITMNRDRLLADAKRRALELADGYRPPEPVTLRLPGATARAALDLGVRNLALTGQALPHDVVVAHALATVLSGGDADVTGPVDEQHLLDLERDAVVSLLHDEGSLLRMEHMLTTGKPLRN